MSKFYNIFNKNSILRRTIPELLVQYCNVNQNRPPQVRFSNYTRQPHNWKRQMEENNEKRKIIPKLVYLHNPWKYFITKLNLLKLQFFWDRDFAAVVLTDIIRNQNTTQVGRFTTPIGFQQITRDMVLSRNDTRLKLVRFDPEHLRRAIPMKVATRHNYGRKFCFIDMLFVGLRNTKDFDNPEEVVEVNEVLRIIDTEFRTPTEVLAVPHRILFAEIFIRFRRDYTQNSRGPFDNGQDNDWSRFEPQLELDVAKKCSSIGFGHPAPCDEKAKKKKKNMKNMKNM
uniref:Uncharacterized protein n=1 Tax=Glossina palpalis gambiensis TaxID=67801 RepID=A0A1B0BRR6_9MUSC